MGPRKSGQMQNWTITVKVTKGENWTIYIQQRMFESILEICFKMLAIYRKNNNKTFDLENEVVTCHSTVDVFLQMFFLSILAIPETYINTKDKTQH